METSGVLISCARAAESSPRAMSFSRFTSRTPDVVEFAVGRVKAFYVTVAFLWKTLFEGRLRGGVFFFRRKRPRFLSPEV